MIQNSWQNICLYSTERDNKTSDLENRGVRRIVMYKNSDRFKIKKGNIVEIKNVGKFIGPPKIVLDIANCDVESLEATIESGYDINAKIEEVDLPPLELALYMGQFESIKWLVSHGADLNNKEEPSFLIAVNFCDKEIIRYLAENGADIHVTRDMGVDAFEEALFLERYDNLSIIDEVGHTAEEYGGNAFRTAVLRNQMDAVEIFIRLRVDINYHKYDMVFTYNETPLCIAVRHDNLKMVKYLVEHGADTTIPDKTGMRPYNIALEQGNYKIAEYIKSFEPDELHSLQNKLQDLKKYKLTETLLTFLQSDAPRLELGEAYTIEYIEFFSLVDTIEMKIGRRKLLRISKEVGDYPDLMLLWNPKDQCVSYYDMEHENFGNIAPWEKFIENAGEYMESYFNGEFD